uniref:Uncharacterized protein n=1 Tax=Arundo donax TaxID=35708 RepID=A0A0A9BPB5_ARUDO
MAENTLEYVKRVASNPFLCISANVINVVSPSPFLANPAISAFQETPFFESSLSNTATAMSICPHRAYMSRSALPTKTSSSQSRFTASAWICSPIPRPAHAPAALKRLANVNPLSSSRALSMPGSSASASSGMSFCAYPAMSEVQETMSRLGIPSNTSRASETAPHLQ